MQNANVDYPDLSKFWLLTSQADFLFGKEIRVYIDEIHSHGVNLHVLHNMSPERPNYDHNAVVSGHAAELTWFSKQFDIAKMKFAKYLAMKSK